MKLSKFLIYFNILLFYFVQYMYEGPVLNPGYPYERGYMRIIDYLMSTGTEIITQNQLELFRKAGFALTSFSGCVRTCC